MSSPFAAVEVGFTRLSDAGVLAITDAPLPARRSTQPIPLVELRKMLLHPTVSYDERDRLLHVVLARAQAQPDPWMVGLTGMLLPGLRGARNEIIRRNPTLAADRDAHEDLEAELLAGLIEAARILPAGTPRVAAELLRGAARRGRRLARDHAGVHDPASLDDPDLPGSPAEPSTGTPGGPPPSARGPEDVLAEAVEAGVLTPEDAELIAETRLGTTDLAQLADRWGIPYATLRQRRHRAEAALKAWLADPDREAKARGQGGRPRLAPPHGTTT